MAQDPERNVEVDYVSDEEKPYIEMEIAMVPDAKTMASLPKEFYDASRPDVIVDAQDKKKPSAGSSSSSSLTPSLSSSTSSSSVSSALSSVDIAASAVPMDEEQPQRGRLIEEI
jgi:hypothetical protein